MVDSFPAESLPRPPFLADTGRRHRRRLPSRMHREQRALIQNLSRLAACVKPVAEQYGLACTQYCIDTKPADTLMRMKRSEKP